MSHEYGAHHKSATFLPSTKTLAQSLTSPRFSSTFEKPALISAEPAYTRLTARGG